MNFNIELTSTPITSHSGLAFVGGKLADLAFERHMATMAPRNTRSDRIPDADLDKTMVELICCGKPHFDAVAEYAGDSYFPQVLAVHRLPSAPTLRQRIESLPEKAGKAFRGFTTRLLAGHPEYLTEQKHGTEYCPVHVDASPMDNSGSSKEGVSCTYKKFDGYAPHFRLRWPSRVYVGQSAAGRQDPQQRGGTLEWLKRVLRRARPDGQLLTEPKITIEAYWTSLDWSPHAIQRFYEKRGTSEQFYSELKTDLERLPSGKLQGNQHVLDLGMMAYNLLRLRTVMQNLIYMAGRWISHARQWTLRIFECHGWPQAALSLAPD